MHHPRSRGERRAVREQVIARRKFIATQIWQVECWSRPPHEHEHWYMPEGWTPMEWGKYAKFNLNCGDTMCHGAKYFKCASKRRKARKEAESTSEFRRRNKAID